MRKRLLPAFSDYLITVLIVLPLMTGCSPDQEQNEATEPVEVEMVTDYGTMVIRLYDETPLHRDNFTKLVRDHVFDSLLFHRVIEEFMIQAGDTESATASPTDTLGDSDLPYTVPAEFHPALFHKKGAVAAARWNHPERASSSTQFYVVQGRIMTDSLLDAAEERINEWLAPYYYLHDPANKELLDSLHAAIEEENWEKISQLNTVVAEQSEGYDNYALYRIPEAHRNTYKTVGGTPFLDQNYTVFGEVTEGLHVIDSIAAVETGLFDRPVRDVRIQSMRIRPRETSK